MALFRVTFTIDDNQSPSNGQTTKTFEGDFADFATADTAAGNLRTDLDAAMLAKVVKTELTSVTNHTPSIGAGSNVFLRAIGRAPINNNKNAAFVLPSPASALQVAGGALDTSATAWTNLIDNFVSGEWYVSDGEHIDTSISYGSGRIAYVRSGSTNFS